MKLLVSIFLTLISHVILAQDPPLELSLGQVEVSMRAGNNFTTTNGMVTVTQNPELIFEKGFEN